MSSSTLLSLGSNRLTTMVYPSHLPILQWGPHQPELTSSLPIRGCTNATRAHHCTRWNNTSHPNTHNSIPHNHKETPQPHHSKSNEAISRTEYQNRFRTWEVRHGRIFVLGSSRPHTQRHLFSNCNTLRRSHRCPTHGNPKTPQPKYAQHRVKTQERKLTIAESQRWSTRKHRFLSQEWEEKIETRMCCVWGQQCDRKTVKKKRRSKEGERGVVTALFLCLGRRYGRKIKKSVVERNESLGEDGKILERNGTWRKREGSCDGRWWKEM